jgi:hypothetical protein
MTTTEHHAFNSAFLRLMDEFEQFDGTCDPAFDSDYDELERQFAELRFASANGLI